MQETVLSSLDKLTIYRRKILDLSNNFDFSSFYNKEYGVETAIGLITKEQSLFIPCILTNSDNHGKNFQIMYDAIYYPFKQIVGNGVKSWQNYVTEDGNIAFQMNYYGDCFIWLPPDISEYQLKELKRINKKLKEITNLYSERHSLKLFFDVHAWVITDNNQIISFELDDNDLCEVFDYYDNLRESEHNYNVKQ